MNDNPFIQLEQNLKQAMRQTPQCADSQFILLRLFHHLHPRIISELNQALQPFHIQHHEWTALLMAYAAPDYQILPSTLSSLLDLTRTSLTRLSDDLVSKGLLCRCENRQDRRQIVLQLTEAGVKCIQTAAPVCAAARRQMLSVFTAGERKQFEQLLRRLLTHLSQDTLPENSLPESNPFQQWEYAYLSHQLPDTEQNIGRWVNRAVPKFG